MNGLSASAALEVATGVLAALLVLALGLEPSALPSALTGVAMATLFGGLALVLKQQALAPRSGASAAAELQAVMAAMGLAMGLRVLCLLLGGLALKRQGVDPTAFVLSFFGCAAVQQAIEIRFVLAARPVASAVTEVSRP